MSTQTCFGNTTVFGNQVNYPTNCNSYVGPLSSAMLSQAGLMPALETNMTVNSDGLAYIVDDINQLVPEGGVGIAQVASGNPIFSTIYQGTPLDLATNQLNVWQNPGQANNGVYTNNHGTPVPGPQNTGKFANYQVNAWGNSQYNGASIPQYPFYLADPWPGMQGNTDHQQMLTTILTTDYDNSQDYHDAMSKFLPAAYAGGYMAQDWQFMLGQGVKMGYDDSNNQKTWFNSMIRKIGGENGTPQKGGLYTIATVPYPLDQPNYDPSTVSVKDLVNACARTAGGVALSPSFGFAGYCMDDLVFPDAWDKTQTKTLACPTTTSHDKNGKPVKLPGIICVAGNNTDATQMADKVNPQEGGLNHDAFFQTADLAPACFDLAVNGNAPVEHISGKLVSTDTGIGLEPWYLKNFFTSSADNFYWPGNMSQWNHCIPEVVPDDWTLCSNKCQTDSKGNVINKGFNVIQRCFNEPPSNVTYGNLYFKNVCQSQLPMDQWGHYAALNNKNTSSAGLVEHNFDAPGQGTAAPTDILGRWWRAQPIHNKLTTGGTIYGTWLSPSLHALVADQNGDIVATSEVTMPTFTGFGSSNPIMQQALDKGLDNVPPGLVQYRDMSSFYAQYGLTTQQGNYGSVPGAADFFGIDATATYTSPDFVW